MKKADGILSKEELLIYLLPFRIFLSWTKSHPIILTAILISYASAIGFMYEKTLFRQFQINPFNYLQYTDFFIGWTRNTYVLNDAFQAFVRLLLTLITFTCTLFIFSESERNIFTNGNRNHNKNKLLGEILSYVCFALFISAIILDSRSYYIENDMVYFGSYILSIEIGLLPACYIGIHHTYPTKKEDKKFAPRISYLFLALCIIYYVFITLGHTTGFAKHQADALKNSDKYFLVYLQQKDSSKSVIKALLLSNSSQYSFFYIKEENKVIAISKANIEKIEFQLSEPNTTPSKSP